MSVRRLAEPAVQPASFAFNEANAAAAQRWIAKYPPGRQQSAIIPLLMLAQEQEGWVTQRSIEAIADMLGMPYIRALEVATFYTQFQLKPVGTRAHVQVCGTTPCMLRGAGDLIEVCRSKIHHEQFHRNAGGTLSWEEVECLGACVNAPMVMIFKDTYEDLTPERLAEIIDLFEAGEGGSVMPGPQNGRVASAPIKGLTSLTEEVIPSGERRPELAGEQPAAPAAAGPSIPPSNAGKPSSRAVETDASLKTPSPEKTDAEKAPEPVATPNAAVADLAEPAVEGEVKTRKRKTKATGAADAKAPELIDGGPVGPDGKRLEGEGRAPVGKRSPEGGNMTREGTPAETPAKDDGEA